MNIRPMNLSSFNSNVNFKRVAAPPSQNKTQYYNKALTESYQYPSNVKIIDGNTIQFQKYNYDNHTEKKEIATFDNSGKMTSKKKYLGTQIQNETYYYETGIPSISINYDKGSPEEISIFSKSYMETDNYKYDSEKSKVIHTKGNNVYVSEGIRSDWKQTKIGI